MENKRVIDNIFYSEDCNSISTLVNQLHSMLYKNLQTSDTITSDLVDSDYLDEVRCLASGTDVIIHFGTSLRDLKCVVKDETNYRDHRIKIRYEGSKKLCVTDAVIPHSELQDKQYESLKDVVRTFKKHINSLSGYFYELERIDQFCTVMEPLKPTFKDKFRTILLDERTWLHVEVTPEGFASNIHLLGYSEQWQEKLQAGLLNWNHDEDIVENITTMFDIVHFPERAKSPVASVGTANPTQEAVCNICLGTELPDIPGLPQPLCQNPQCVVYFHRHCLFEWLVACSGGRPPVFGVATGSCPTCLQPTTCSEKDT